MASNLAALRKIIKEFVKSVEDKETYLAEFQTLVDKIEEAKEFDTLTLGRRIVERLQKCVGNEYYNFGQMDGKNYKIIGEIRYSKKNYREEADNVPFGIPTYRHLTYLLNNDYIYRGLNEEAYVTEIVVNPSGSKIVQKIIQKKSKSSYLKEHTVRGLYSLWLHPFIYVTQFIPKGQIIVSYDYTMKPSYNASCSWWEFDKSEYDESLDKYKLSKGKFSETHPDWIKNEEFLELVPEHTKKLTIYYDTLKEMKSILLKSGAKPKAYMKYFLHNEENANNVKTFKRKPNKKGGRTRKVR